MKISWNDLVAQEPRLTELLAEVRAMDDGRSSFFCGAWLYSGDGPGRPGLKERLSRLVGWGARHRRGTVLASSAAWDAALRTIVRALPPCRNCGCCDIYGNFV